jgi:hypothetical protein
MNDNLKTDLAQLRLYLNNLAGSIPCPAPGCSQYHFETFAPDPEWVTDIGEEGAVNRELEVRLGSRAAGPVVLKERGPGITALPDTLERYLTKYPDSVLLRKWLEDLLVSAKASYKPQKEPVSCLITKHWSQNERTCTGIGQELRSQRKNRKADNRAQAEINAQEDRYEDLTRL